MAKIHQEIPDELFNEFSLFARLRFGEKKGCKKQALIEAIQHWVGLNKMTSTAHSIDARKVRSQLSPSEKEIFDRLGKNWMRKLSKRD